MLFYLDSKVPQKMGVFLVELPFSEGRMGQLQVVYYSWSLPRPELDP